MQRVASLQDGLQACYAIDGENVACDFDANGYRLPTEAEWEFAAIGGNLSRGYRYAGSNVLDRGCVVCRKRGKDYTRAR